MRSSHRLFPFSDSKARVFWNGVVPAVVFFFFPVYMPAISVPADSMCRAAEAQGGTASRVVPSIGTHIPVPGIVNFGEVTPTLYRGGQPSREGLDALTKMRIDVVVNASGSQNDTEGKVVNQLGMKYVAIRWHCPFPKDETFVRFLKVVHDNPGKKIFVHCRLGYDRTGMMIAAYHMAFEGWTAKQALREMHEFGFRGVHHLICPGLEPYARSFPERLKRNPAFKGLGVKSETEASN